LAANEREIKNKIGHEFTRMTRIKNKKEKIYFFRIFF